MEFPVDKSLAQTTRSILLGSITLNRKALGDPRPSASTSFPWILGLRLVGWGTVKALCYDLWTIKDHFLQKHQIGSVPFPIIIPLKPDDKLFCQQNTQRPSCYLDTGRFGGSVEPLRPTGTQGPQVGEPVTVTHPLDGDPAFPGVDFYTFQAQRFHTFICALLFEPRLYSEALEEGGRKR